MPSKPTDVAEFPRGYVTGGGLVPVPDPTTLTTQQLRQEINSLRELVEARMNGQESLFHGMINTFTAETAEKFAGVAAQFSERDTRTDQRAGDTKLAVDAAFAAAKEATAKIEAGFTKQIDSMSGVIDTKTANLDGRINDIKDAVNRMTGHSRGLGDSWSIIIAVVMAGLVLVEIFVKR